MRERLLSSGRSKRVNYHDYMVIKKSSEIFFITQYYNIFIYIYIYMSFLEKRNIIRKRWDTRFEKSR